MDTSSTKENNDKSYYAQIGFCIPIITGSLISAAILVPSSIFFGIKPIIGLIFGIAGQIIIVLIVATILSYYPENNPKKMLVEVTFPPKIMPLALRVLR